MNAVRGVGRGHTMKILILDTETNGLPKNRFAPPSQFDAYPAILQLSWAIYTLDETMPEMGLVRTESQDVGLALHPSIPWDAGAAAIHGLSEREARHGTSAATALKDLAVALRGVDVVIAHNLAFDKPVIRAAGYAEAARGGDAALRSLWPTTIQEFCTMRETRDLLRIPSPYYSAPPDGSPPQPDKFKAPKLNELYAWIYGQVYDISGATLHNSASDTDCLAKCVQGLIKRGVLRVVDGHIKISNASCADASSS
jgi:DNA polymerase III epsilon subunit-like protein